MQPWCYWGEMKWNIMAGIQPFILCRGERALGAKCTGRRVPLAALALLGGDVNTVNSDGWFPLLCAVTVPSMATLLLEAGAHHGWFEGEE